MIAWIGALSTFVGREQDAHKREEREEADGAGEQHVVFLQISRTSFAPAGLSASGGARIVPFLGSTVA
jgi:hypothetical protein